MRASRLKRKVGKATPGPKYPSAHVLYKRSLGWADIPHRGPLGGILSGERGNAARKRGLRAFIVR